MNASRIVDNAKQLFSNSASTYRRPTDVLYLALGTALFLITSLILVITRDYFASVDLNLSNTPRDLPVGIALVLRLVVQAGSPLVIPVAAAASLAVGNALLARNMAISGAAAWLLAPAIRALAVRGAPEDLLEQAILRGTDGMVIEFPSTHVAIVSSLATVATPHLSRRGRWLVWALVVLVAFARMYGGGHLPIDVIGGLALGVMVGALANLVLGVPHRDLSVSLIKRAFEEQGLPVTEIVPVDEATRRVVAYFVWAANGDEYFVKLVGSEQRNADFLFKVWRVALFKNVASVSPFLTSKQQAEHEAYLTLLAKRHGTRTPDVEFTTRAGDEFTLLAQKRIPGRTLADLEPEEIHEALLVDIWQQVKNLHDARILHGNLCQSNVLVDDENRAWIIDFGLAEAGADEELLGQDTAQMLASIAAITGAERAVGSALTVLGPEEVGAAGPRLEPLALSAVTQDTLQVDPDLVEELQKAIVEQIDSEIPEDESILRIQPQHLFWVLGLGAGVYFLLPQLGELNEIAEIWRSAHYGWLGVGLLMSALTYVLAAVTLRGAVTKALGLWRTLLANLAASFANRFGPRNVGGVVLLERYVEKSGVKRVKAITAVTVKTAVDIIVHTGALLLAVSLLDLDDMGLLENIEVWQVAVAALAVVLVLIFVLRSPARWRSAVRSLQVALGELRGVLRQPGRALQLLGGSLGMTLMYIATLLVSLYAVGVDLPILQVAAVYLAGELIGSASPTPGGLGVLEGAYIAALTALGTSPSQAVAAVLFYRLLTFWLPIFPGLLALRRLQRQGSI